MFGIQPLHLVIIAIVALIIFGPKRLPQIGRGIAKAMRDLRSGMKEMGEGFHEEYNKTPAPADGAQTSAHTADAPARAGETPATGPFCTQCGASNPPDSRFCCKCGQAIAGIAS